jgi:membrane-bound serine protease (ClpP class)
MTRTRKWMRRNKRLGLLLPLSGCLMLAFSAFSAEEETGRISVITIAGSINSGSADYVMSNIENAEKRNDACLILELDTPGGVLNDTENMVKKMMSAKIPVVVFVWPKAAQAASAGTFITLAAHVAAMAPGTRIGAAHPVPMFSVPDDKDENKKKSEQRDFMVEKVENDTVSFIVGVAKERKRNEAWAEKSVRQSVSITADVAVSEKVVDLIADSMDDLLQKIDGREIRLDEKTTVTLKTKGVPIQRHGMTLKQRLLNFLADPNILFILFALGAIGILMEFYHPGGIFPGAVGAICLLLAFTSMQILPVNYGGLILMLVGIGLFVAEVYVTSYGLLGIGGTVLFLAGGILLVDPASGAEPYYIDPGFSVQWSVLIPMALTMAALFFYIGYFVIRSQRRKSECGMEGMLGLIGEARSEIKKEGGHVFVHGEIWKAESEEVIPAGSSIQVVRMEGLKLFVKKA